MLFGHVREHDESDPIGRCTMIWSVEGPFRNRRTTRFS
jgi:hypothetical protein